MSDFDEARIEQEIALLALKHDASEELDRISFHSKSLNDETNKKNEMGIEGVVSVNEVDADVIKKMAVHARA